MHRRAPAVLGLALLALAAWLLFGHDSGSPRERAASAASQPQGAAALDPAAADAAAADPATAAAGAQERVAIPGPQDTPDAPAPATGASLRVRVLDHEGHPAAAVSVRFAVAPTQILSRLHEVGTAATGADGIAVLALEPLEKAQQQARAHGITLELMLIAERPLTPAVELPLGADIPAQQPVEIHLPPPIVSALQVLVEDADGVPRSGIDVLLAVTSPLAGDESELGNAASGPDGIARVPLDELLPQLQQRALFQVPNDLVVRADLPLAQPAVLHLGPALPQEQPVRLVLPPCGRFVVELTDQDGKPVPAESQVGLWWRPAGSDDEVRYERLEHHLRNPREGEVAFEAVGLGLEFQLSASLPGREGASTRDVPGPTQPGQELRYRMQLGVAWPVVTGRLRCEDGRVLTGQRVSVSAEGPEFRLSRGLTIPIEADGRFRWVLGGHYQAGARRAYLFRLGDSAQTDPVQEPCSAVVDLSFELAPGSEHDIGEVVLQREPLLVAGAVVDAAGVPVPSCWLDVRAAASEEGSAGELIFRSMLDASGRFSVRWPRPVDSLEVTAWTAQRDYQPAVASGVAAGTPDLRLVMRPGQVVERSTLQVMVQVDEGFPPLLLHCRLSAENGPQHDQEISPWGAPFEGLEPGRVRLEFLTQETDWPVAQMESVEVLAGSSNRLPQMVTVDLRGRLQWFHARLSAGGLPLANLRVELRESGAQGRGGSLKTDREGRLAVLAPATMRALWLKAPGYLPATVSAGSEQTITLVPE